jgi:hypothetical protein
LVVIVRYLKLQFSVLTQEVWLCVIVCEAFDNFEIKECFFWLVLMKILGLAPSPINAALVFED